MLVFASNVVLLRMGGPLDTDMPEVVKNNSNCAVVLSEGNMDIDVLGCDGGLFDRFRGAS